MSAARGASEFAASNVVIFEAEDFAANIARSGQAWAFTNAVPGYVGAGYMTAAPDTGTIVLAGWTNTSPELQYAAHFPARTTYYVWVRAHAADGNNDSLHFGIDGQAAAQSQLVWSTHGTWNWTNLTAAGSAAAVSVNPTGLHTVSLWMREDGARVDRLLLTTNAAFKPRIGNAWHRPLGSEGTFGFMRAPMLEIYSNTAVTLFSGNQYQGAGDAGNQLQSGSRILYKHATGTVWNVAPMTNHSTSGNNIYYRGTIPPGLFQPGDTVQYYLRIPYSDYLPAYLCSSGGANLSVEDEDFARANPHTYTVLAAPPPGFPSPADWGDENIYFIFTDRFNDGDPSNNSANPESPALPSNSRRIHGGDFKGIQQKLDYIKALGATAIWITPIPQNVGNSAYHGYGAGDFTQLQANWGTMADLSNMVAAAHAKGIRVLLDIVCNHMGNRIDSSNAGYPAYKSSGYTLKWRNASTPHPAPFDSLNYFHNNGHIGNFVDPDQILGELNGLDDLRTETAHVRTNLVRMYKEWIRAADFDGFRLDTVKHTEIGVWQHFNSEIRAFAAAIGKTNFFQFGEVFDGSDGKCGYYTGTKAGGAFANDSVVDYPLYFKVNSVFATASGNTKQIEDRYNAITGNYDAAATNRLVTFLDNHDQQRFMYQNNANNNTGRLAVALSFLYTSRGIPCLYYGTEQNFNGGGDPNNREDMWDGLFEQGPSLGDNFDMTRGTYLHIAKLNNFRRLYPSLRRGAHRNLWNNPGGPGLFAYSRRLGDEETFVVFNTASGSQTLPNRPTSYPAGTTLVNLLNTNETLTVAAGADGIPSVNVPAGSAKIFIAASLLKPLDPAVVAQSPAHGVTNAPAANGVTLTFSKPMNTNAAQAAFTVQPPVGGSFAWSAGRDVMTFTPSPGFAGSTTIVVRVETNAADADSTNGLHAAFETFFHTAPASYTDAVPPALLVQAPAPGATLSNTVTVSGTATDNVAVLSVELRLDGGEWVAVTGTTAWSYALDSRNFLNGSHLLSVRATDSSGNTSSNGVQTVRFFNVPGDYERRLNAGGATAVTNCDAAVWLPDAAHKPGGFGYASGTNGFIGNAISNVCADAQTLYQSERYSPPASTMRYLFDCPEGVYETVLLQTETWVTGPGQREFDLYIQGQRMLTNLDVFVTSGGMNLPLTLYFTNDVTDAQLELHFIPQVDNARVSAIQVRRIADVDTDGDGIPNWWTRGWFDHPTGQDADGSRAEDDPDQDGFNNLAEFIALTSPLDPDLFLRIHAIDAEEHTAVSLWSAAGRIYHLDRKTDLLGTDEWTQVEGGLPGVGATLTILDTNDVDHGAYRIRVTVP